MRGIDELDHYELLEIPRGATADEIERAYRLSQQTYGEGSLALYSVFESDDAAAIRSRLDEAFRVLSDEETRATYDENQAFAPPEFSTIAPPPPASSAPALDQDSWSQMSIHDAVTESIDDIDGVHGAPDVQDAHDEYDAFEDDGAGEFDGLRLRRTRLFRGYEIDDISDVTKVSGAHLRNLEEENFIDLPADVYVRGFVTAYAKTIGLDPKVVVPSFMARVQASRDESQRGRFRGRQ